MPIITQLRCEAIQFVVGEETVPVIEDGQQVHDAFGVPKTFKRTVVIFTDPATHTRILVPLSDEGKKALVAQLTGGIVVAAAGAVG